MNQQKVTPFKIIAAIAALATILIWLFGDDIVSRFFSKRSGHTQILDEYTLDWTQINCSQLDELPTDLALITNLKPLWSLFCNPSDHPLRPSERDTLRKLVSEPTQIDIEYVAYVSKIYARKELPATLMLGSMHAWLKLYLIEVPTDRTPELHKINGFGPGISLNSSQYSNNQQFRLVVFLFPLTKRTLDNIRSSVFEEMVAIK